MFRAAQSLTFGARLTAEKPSTRFTVPVGHSAALVGVTAAHVSPMQVTQGEATSFARLGDQPATIPGPDLWVMSPDGQRGVGIPTPGSPDIVYTVDGGVTWQARAMGSVLGLWAVAWGPNNSGVEGFLLAGLMIDSGSSFGSVVWSADPSFLTAEELFQGGSTMVDAPFTGMHWDGGDTLGLIVHREDPGSPGRWPLWVASYTYSTGVFQTPGPCFSGSGTFDWVSTPYHVPMGYHDGWWFIGGLKTAEIALVSTPGLTNYDVLNFRAASSSSRYGQFVTVDGWGISSVLVYRGSGVVAGGYYDFDGADVSAWVFEALAEPAGIVSWRSNGFPRAMAVRNNADWSRLTTDGQTWAASSIPRVTGVVSAYSNEGGVWLMASTGFYRLQFVSLYSYAPEPRVMITTMSGAQKMSQAMPVGLLAGPGVGGGVPGAVSLPPLAVVRRYQTLLCEKDMVEFTVEGLKGGEEVAVSAQLFISPMEVRR